MKLTAYSFIFFLRGGTLHKKNWRKKYAACHSTKQSPINIDEDLTQVNGNQKKLQSQSWDQTALGNAFIHDTCWKTGKVCAFGLGL